MVKDIYPNGIVNQTEQFALRQKIKKILSDNIENIIKEETIKSFKSAGYDENENYMFVSGDNKKIAKGVSQGKLTVTVSTPKMLNMGAVSPISYMQKVTTYGAKKIVSEMFFEVIDDKVNIDYKNTEAASFSSNELNKSGTISSIENEKVFKKELKDFFKSITDAEVKYLTGTKIANDDKINKNMNDSIIKENKMNLKDLFNASFEEAGEKINNFLKESISIDETTKDKKVDGTPSTKDGNATDKKLVIGNEEKENSENPVEEMTSSGGGAAGGSYLTPHAFTNDGKTKAFETNKNLGYTEVKMNESVKNTTYGQMRTLRAYSERQYDGSYKIISENTIKTPYINPIEMNKEGWPPKGMEHNFAIGLHGVELNSKEELKKTGHGNLNMLKKENYEVINETGEWDDNDEEMIYWKEDLEQKIEQIVSRFPDKIELSYIEGFDKYQGPYAYVFFGDKEYRVWTSSQESLWIEDFPIDNTSEKGLREGFEGSVDEIIEMLNKYFNELNENTKINLLKRKFVTPMENEVNGINKRYIITEKFTKDEEISRWKKLYENECFCDIKDKISREEYEAQANEEFEKNNEIESDLCNTVYSGEEEGFKDVPKTQGSLIVFRLSESDIKKNKMYLIDHFTKKLVYNPLYNKTVN